MKAHIATAAFVLASVPAFAQATGVSNPEPVTITTTDDSAAPVITPKSAQAKPSAATPVQAPAEPVPAAAPAPVVYGAYVPYKGAVTPAPTASIAAADDPDAMIVTSVPEREGELREGTLLRTRIMEDISTTTTAQGSRFTAELTEPIERAGRVVLPAGSILEGRVTEVHGGRRITGGAALHLETQDILLPDGTHYIVHAQLVDTTKNGLKVNNEGTLKRRDNAKETAVVIGGVTGAGAVTGALVGGGVGAVVGAGIGAGVSTVLWLKEDRQATLPKDVGLVFSLTTPMILTPLTNTPGGLKTHDGDGMGAAQ